MDIAKRITELREETGENRIAVLFARFNLCYNFWQEKCKGRLACYKI